MANYNTYTGLTTEAQAIADETTKKANTATRIGTMFKGVLNYFYTQFQTLTAVSCTATVATSDNIAITYADSYFKIAKADIATALVAGNLIFAKSQTTTTEIGIYLVQSADDTYYYCTRSYTVSAVNKVYVLEGAAEGTWHKDGNGDTVTFVRITDKANSEDVYTKAASDTLLAAKADAATVATELAAKADLVSGKIPASELPSYVDDVIEGYYSSSVFYSDSALTTAITGETGKIYVDLTTNTSYRYTGSTYVRIDEIDLPLSVENGGTGSTAKNFVDLTTAQIVAGIKTFSSLLNANAGLNATGNVALNVGSDATGDMYYRNSTGLVSRLAKGIDGQFLGLNGGVPTWITQTLSSSVSTNANANFTILSNYVSEQGSTETTLPLALFQDNSGGKIYLSNNNITFQETGQYLVLATINGTATTAGTGNLYLYTSSERIGGQTILYASGQTYASLACIATISSITDTVYLTGNYSTSFGGDDVNNRNHVTIIKLVSSSSSSTYAISEANPTSPITINSTQQHLTLTQNYVHNWTTNYYTAPSAGILEVSGFIEWSPEGGTTNPLKIFLVINGVEKTIGTGSQGSTGKVAHIVLCGTIDVSAGDIIYIDGTIGGNTALISTNSEIKYKITNS